MRRRQGIADAARAAGLGEVVRVHSEHGGGAVAAALWLLAALSAVPAAIASIILQSETSTTWQWPLLACAGLAGAAWLWTHAGPVPGGRRWLAVAEGGIVVWSRGAARAVPWAEAHGLDLASVCNLGDLRESIARRRPVAAWTRRRAAGLAVTGLVAAVAAWFTGVPIALHVLVGERPTDLTHFARMCDGGEPFGRTAAYAGPAPHPVAVYGDGSGDFPDYTATPRPEPDAVQLVGCTRLTGTVSPDPIEVCEYEGGHDWETYQGRYRVDVYEARTGRQVTSFGLDGVGPDGPCLPRILVPAGSAGETSTFHTDPSPEAYRTRLAPLVNG